MFVGLEHKKETLRKYQNSNSGGSYHSWDHRRGEVADGRTSESREGAAESRDADLRRGSALLMLVPWRAGEGP